MINEINKYALRFNEATADRVKSLCAPLFNNAGVTHFGYLKILNDGRMLRLTNNVEWTKKYFEKAYYNDIDFYSMKNAPNSGFRLSLLVGKPEGNHCLALCNDYNVWNAIVLYEKFNNYCKHCFFGAHKDNIEAVNFYINNIPLLRKFLFYFEEEASDLLKNSNQKSLISTQVKICQNSLQEEQKNEEILRQIYSQDSHGLPFSFSKREAECLKYLLRGKSAKEIARTLDLSPRTVETYIVNIKQKTGNKRKSQIIDTFEKCNLINELNNL